MTFVPLRAQSDATGNRGQSDKRATFGQRRSSGVNGHNKNSALRGFEGNGRGADGVEMSWIPSSSSRLVGEDDMLVSGGPGNSKKRQDRHKGVETFGAGMERGALERHAGMSDGDRRGRTERRKGVRSGSKNTFRRV